MFQMHHICGILHFLFVVEIDNASDFLRLEIVLLVKASTPLHCPTHSQLETELLKKHNKEDINNQK